MSHVTALVYHLATLIRNKVAKCTLGTHQKLERPGIPKFLVKSLQIYVRLLEILDGKC